MWRSLTICSKITLKCTGSQELKGCFSYKLSLLFILSAWNVNRKSPLPLDISESGRVTESFSKRVAVNFQLGYLGTQKRATLHEYSVRVLQCTKCWPIHPLWLHCPFHPRAPCVLLLRHCRAEEEASQAAQHMWQWEDQRAQQAQPSCCLEQEEPTHRQHYSFQILHQHQSGCLFHRQHKSPC